MGRITIALLGGLVVLLVLHNIAMAWMVRSEVRHAVRDPGTGILAGAEPRTLGPEDADCAVLLVHGHVGAGSNFADLPERLAARGMRVRVMRLPGHGTTPMDYDTTTEAELLAAVRSELERLRAEHGKVVLVGHSMGGALCTITAADGGADGLVLLAPYFGVTHKPWYVLTPEAWARVLAPLAPWVYKGELFLQLNRREAVGKVLSYRIVPSSSLVRMQSLAARARRPETLEAIRCPVLWVHSMGDVAASHAIASSALSGMTNARVEVLTLQRSNHHLLFDHEREQVKRAVEDFVVRVGGPEV